MSGINPVRMKVKKFPDGDNSLMQKVWWRKAQKVLEVEKRPAWLEQNTEEGAGRKMRLWKRAACLACHQDLTPD